MKRLWMMAAAALTLGPLACSVALAGETTVWKSVAMACVPTAQTAGEQVYVTTGGRVKHRPGTTGSISFVCPIDNPASLGRGWFRLSAYGKQDDSLPLASRYIHAALKFAKDQTGAVMTAMQTESTFTGTPMVEVTSIKTKVHFDSGLTYWVQITLDRPRVNYFGGVEQIPEILSVELLEGL